MTAIRKLLFDKLMEGASPQMCEDELGFRLFQASTNEDLKKIEPVILDLLAKRDEELRTKMICGHPIVLVELAPFAEQPKMPAEKEGYFILDAKKVVYRCSACEREKRFVRALVEHVRKRAPLNVAPNETEVLAAGREA